MDDVRLPKGYKSWTQLANYCMTQDEANFKLNTGQFKQRITYDTEYLSKPPGEPDEDVFECDIMTLKLRAFDELKDLLPSGEALIHMKLQIQLACSGRDVQDFEAIKFIDKLLTIS